MQTQPKAAFRALLPHSSPWVVAGKIEGQWERLSRMRLEGQNSTDPWDSWLSPGALAWQLVSCRAQSPSQLNCRDLSSDDSESKWERAVIGMGCCNLTERGKHEAGQGQSHSELVLGYQGEERLKTREEKSLPTPFPKATGTRIQVPLWLAPCHSLRPSHQRGDRIYVMGADESLVALVLSPGVQ